MIKSTILFIPGMNWIIVIKLFVRIILFNYSWFNIGRFINNTLFLWYITANSRYIPIFNCSYITPGMLFCTNIKNLLCDSTCNKTKNLCARKWIILMPKMTVTISDVFSFPNKFIRIKWTIIVIKVSLLIPEYVLSNSHLVFRYFLK